MRNKIDFKNKISEATKKASKAGMAASFGASFDESLSAQQMSEIMSEKFGEAFADTFANEFPAIIDEYLESITFDTTKLTANGAPVMGLLKVLPAT